MYRRNDGVGEHSYTAPKIGNRSLRSVFRIYDVKSNAWARNAVPSVSDVEVDSVVLHGFLPNRKRRASTGILCKNFLQVL